MKILDEHVWPWKRLTSYKREVFQLSNDLMRLQMQLAAEQEQHKTQVRKLGAILALSKGISITNEP